MSELAKVRRDIKFDCQSMEEIGIGEHALSDEDIAELRERCKTLVASLDEYEALRTSAQKTP
jgi:hypothetical protein